MTGWKTIVGVLGAMLVVAEICAIAWILTGATDIQRVMPRTAGALFGVAIGVAMVIPFAKTAIAMRRSHAGRTKAD